MMVFVRVKLLFGHNGAVGSTVSEKEAVQQDMLVFEALIFLLFEGFK